MSSDPPPLITLNNNSNVLPITRINQQPSTLPVVMQPSQLTQEFDSVLNTPSQSNFQNQQHTYTQDWLIDHADANPSPILELSTPVPHFPMPTNHSPGIISKASSHHMMDDTSN